MLDAGIFDFYDPTLFDLGAGASDQSLLTVSRYLDLVGDKPTNVLDVGAGTGRIAIPLLRIGHHVTCVDTSTSMLSALAKKIEELGLERATLLSGELPHRTASQPLADIAIAVDDFLIELNSLASLQSFWSRLSSWIRPGGSFHTDIRHREIDELRRYSKPPYCLRAFPLRALPDADIPHSWLGVSYWEEFDEATFELKTTCRYELIDASGSVRASKFRMLNQRIHPLSDIISSAEKSGFELVISQSSDDASRLVATNFGGIFHFRRVGG